MILEWHSTKDKLPGIGRDILGYNAESDELEIGYRSESDTDNHKWLDFHFPVTHWAYIDMSRIASESNTEQKAAIQMGRVFEDERKRKARENLSNICEVFIKNAIDKLNEALELCKK